MLKSSILWVGLCTAASVHAQAVEVRKLTEQNPASNRYWGWSTALSGNRALVGAPYDDLQGVTAGAAFVFERDATGSWQQTAALRASDGEEGYYLGVAVALGSDIALVGSPGDDDPVPKTGTVYVFERNPAGQWNETDEIETGIPGGGFGYSLSLEGSRVVVGAPYPSSGATLPGPGRAFVFERDATGHWNLTATLIPSDGGVHDAFGLSVALSGDRILIGAITSSGPSVDRAYVFERDPGGSWIERAKLLGGGVHAVVENSVALDGERAFLGSSGADGRVWASGVVFVFERASNGTWPETARLFASDGEFNDRFGADLGLSGHRLLVGARGDNLGPAFGPGHNAGSAYVFELGATGAWRETQRIDAQEESIFAEFGGAVALEGDRALIGAAHADDEAGAAYVFDLEPLSADVGQLSIASGGVQSLQLDAGHVHGGLRYRVLGSLSGTDPGVPLPPGFVLPLNHDAYLVHTMTNPRRPPLGNASGTLDASGSARATFTLPPGLPISLIGRTVHHAFIAFQQGEGVVRFVSNPRPLLLVP